MGTFTGADGAAALTIAANAHAGSTATNNVAAVRRTQFTLTISRAPVVSSVADTAR